MSSLSISEFDPAGAHVAYLVQTLDTQTLKIQPIGRDDSDQTVTVHPFDKKKNSKVKSLSWVSDDALAITFSGSNQCEILNVLSNEVMANLKTDQLISCIAVSAKSHGKVYIVDVNGNLLQYQLDVSLNGWKLGKSYKLGAELRSIDRLLDFNDRYIMLFSNSVYLFDKKEEKVTDLKNLYVSPINYVVADGDSVIVSAENDRFINVLEVNAEGKIEAGKQIFVTESPVLTIAQYTVSDLKLEILVALTEGGILEIFNDPFTKRDENVGNRNKRRNRRKSANAVQSRAADGKVELFRKKSEKPEEAVPIVDIRLNPRFLTIAWLEDSSYLAFDHIEWWEHTSDGVYHYKITNGLKVYRDRPIVNVAQSTDKYGHDLATAKHYNEGQAIVSSGNNFKDLEDGHSEKEGREDEDEEEEEEDDDDFAHLTEKYRSDLGEEKKGKGRGKRGKPQVGSLAVVLSQALKSNDHGLLEMVLNNNRDENVIRSTVARLDTAYVLSLLDRLSERLSRGKGSKSKQLQQQLDTWVKYILIYHGSYLINLPNLSADLNLLSSSMRMRARNLNRLLELRGKISVVMECMEVKRELGKNIAGKQAGNEEGEEDVEYIEAIEDAGLYSDDEHDGDDDEEGAEIMQVDDESDDREDADLQDENADDQGSDEDDQYSDVEEA